MSNQELYDAWHQRLAPSESITESLNHPWHITVGRLLPNLQGLRVLEIGCGRGEFAIWLSDKYSHAEITAIDYSGVAISLAQSRAATRGNQILFKVEDSQALSFENCSFDYVISCECMEHVPYPAKMAKEIYRVLRPGGHFILTTENYFNGMILAWMKTWILGTPFDSGSGVQPYENFFVFWRVKNILEVSGLEVKHMESNHFQWLLLPRTNPSKLATKDFENRYLKRLVLPFGRHFTFCGMRPVSGSH